MRTAKWRRAAGLIAGLASAAAASAAPVRDAMPPLSQQRPDMPGVEPRPIAVDPDRGQRALVGSFAGWNRTHGRPRILVFWDRRLEDETSTRYQDHESGTAISAAGPGIGISAYDRVQRQERLTGGRDGGIGVADSDGLETAFVSAFVDAGANLADRAALMRKVSTGRQRDDRSDQQYMESLALEQGVAYLIEVAPSYLASGSGYRFAVKVTHLPTSRVVAQFSTGAQPNAGNESFVAARGGFRRARANRNTPDLIGGMLASEVMTRLR